MRFSENILFADQLHPYWHSLRTQHTINHCEIFSFILTPKRNWKDGYFLDGDEKQAVGISPFT